MLGARSDPLQTSNRTEPDAVLARTVGSRAPSRAKGIIMNTGTVKFYNGQKGFGFIQPDDGGKDVFVHATALERAGLRGLSEGQKVAYDTQQDHRSGKIAVGNIQVV
jgi:CspA family cold shock protein